MNISYLHVGDLVLVDSNRGPDVTCPRNDLERGLRVWVVWDVGETLVQIRKVNSCARDFAEKTATPNWSLLTRAEASALLLRP